jgi:hypothetical protein
VYSAVIGFVSATVLVGAPLGNASRVLAEVVFDASPSVACRPVTSDEFKQTHPEEMVVEARVQISTLIYEGGADELVELFYQFTSPEQSSEIVDYLPKTTLGSQYAGNIAVENSDEHRDELTVGATGQFNSIVQANAGAIHGTIGRSAVKYEMLPPQELLTAAGTMYRGTGVYFKLRRSAQVSLEGAREFVLMLRVPAGWRGDYVRLACEARGAAGKPKSAAFLVPLYLAGDLQAQGSAEKLGKAERRLLQVARANQREISRRSQPTLAHEWALVDPKIPSNWLSLVAHRPLHDDSTLQFERYLPAEVVQASQEYQRAKRELHALCRTSSLAQPGNSLANACVIPSTP